MAAQVALGVRMAGSQLAPQLADTWPRPGALGVGWGVGVGPGTHVWELCISGVLTLRTRLLGFRLLWLRVDVNVGVGVPFCTQGKHGGQAHATVPPQQLTPPPPLAFEPFGLPKGVMPFSCASAPVVTRHPALFSIYFISV